MKVMSSEDPQFLDIAPEVYRVWSDYHKVLTIIFIFKNYPRKNFFSYYISG